MNPDIKLPFGTLTNVPAKHAEHIVSVFTSTFKHEEPMFPSVIFRNLEDIPEFLDKDGDWTTDLRKAREFSSSDPELYSEYKKIQLEDLDEDISIIFKPMSYRDLAARLLQMEDIDSIASFEDSRGDVLHIFTSCKAPIQIGRVDDHQSFWYNENEANPKYQTAREDIRTARKEVEE